VSSQKRHGLHGFIKIFIDPWSLDFAKGIETPALVDFIVAKYVHVSVTGSNPKILGSWAVPLILNLANLQHVLAQDKAERILFGFVSGITLHLYFTHNSAPVLAFS